MMFVCLDIWYLYMNYSHIIISIFYVSVGVSVGVGVSVNKKKY